MGDAVTEALYSQWLLNGSPTGTVRENFPRNGAAWSDLSAAVTSGVMTTVALPLFAGDTIAYLAFLIGNTSVGTITHGFTALYDQSGALVPNCYSADQTSTGATANTVFQPVLTAPHTVKKDGIFYAAVSWTASAGSVPSLMGVTTTRTGASGAIFTGQKVLAQNSGSSVAGTPPTTIATPTTQIGVPYVVATSVSN